MLHSENFDFTFEAIVLFLFSLEMQCLVVNHCSVNMKTYFLHMNINIRIFKLSTQNSSKRFSENVDNCSLKRVFYFAM